MTKPKNIELWRVNATCNIGLEAFNDETKSSYERQSKALYCILQAIKDLALHLEKGDK